MFKLLGSKLLRKGSHHLMTAYCSQCVMDTVIAIWKAEKYNKVVLPEK